jgi:hypothetical protein
MFHIKTLRSLGKRYVYIYGTSGFDHKGNYIPHKDTSDRVLKTYADAETVKKYAVYEKVLNKKGDYEVKLVYKTLDEFLKSLK